jgi:hypothetical protein
MATSKKQEEVSQSNPLEERKVKALEKIAKSLDALTNWFEDIDKTEWSERIQYYLYEFHQAAVNKKDEEEVIEDEEETESEFVRPTRRIID